MKKCLCKGLSVHRLLLAWAMLLLRLWMTLVVYPPDMILHVVHTAEHTTTLLAVGSSPLTRDAWIMFCFMSRSILL